MSLKLEFFIAKRYLRAKNKEKMISITTIFSFIGIMLGVATLIIVMSVMNGFREDLMSKILGINSHISIYSNDFKDTEEIVKIIKETTNVKSANGIIENQVMIMNNNNTSGAIIKGITNEDLMDKPQIYDNIKAKKKELENNEIILGGDLARKLKVKTGDEIKIISPELNSTIIGTIPRIKTYKVIGSFRSGIYEYDLGTAFIPLETAQTHFKYSENNVSSIEIYLEDISKMEQTYNSIRQKLSQSGISFSMMNWKESNSAFMGALDIERNVMFIILMLIILVATFNIISSLTMLVNDKIQQIALLKTMGFSRTSIMRIFIICGSLIGFCGTFLGFVAGVLVSRNLQSIKLWLEKIFNTTLFPPSVYFLSELPSKIIVSDVVLITSLSLLLSFFATIYPSYKAAKTNPAEVLRYQ
ncbi:MAG: lipoprotein-releasing ABC transporter permease subunit [Rickettsiales bacterium]|jgi:lipoprotein-releasing system permease protein|nr:lipoprotein-releasing ABC transporter permease subunit [Rickettsiales bacterium]